MIVVALSLLGIGFIHTLASYILGTFLLGLGYGVIQPVLYDKTSYFAPNDRKATEYFALLLTSSYIALSCIPFIVEFFGTFIKGNTDPSFPFILNGVIMTILAIVVVVKHKNFVVQAGVIPQGSGIVEEPSSVLAPGTRYVSTSLQDNNRKVGENVAATVAEGLAPVGVPMDISVPSSSASSSASPSISFVSPISPIASEPAFSMNPVKVDNSAPPVTSSPSHSAVSPRAAQIMKDAETSLAQAQISIQQMRQQQVALLKSEAAQLQEKASELSREAAQLIDEANALMQSNEEKSETSEKNEGGVNPNEG